MNTIASPFVNLSAVILGLRVAVAAWGGRRLLDEALVHLVHRRLGEIVRRIEGMVARFQAGRLRPALVRGAGEPGSGDVLRPRREAGVRIWPCRFAWLVRAAAWEAAGFGCQLRAVLETPEMVAFLAACPQAVRVLTPVCRALAIETAVLRPGVAPRADVGAVRVRKQVPRVTPDLGRVPIPRGVMGWVRRDRSAKR
jgi:hypothetical protein